MSSAVYNYTVPSFIKGLNAFNHILKQAESYADEHKIPHEDFINARLYEDMKPLTFQVQVASNTAKGTVAKVTHTEPVPLEDNETTFAELYARIEKTIEILKAADPAAFAAKENSEFQAKLGPLEFTFLPQDYAVKFALPNFYFHLTTAYAILRSKGVPLGKRDYIGSFIAA